MAELFFEVEADYQKVVELNIRLKELEEKIKNATSAEEDESEAVDELEEEYSQLQNELKGYISNAAKAAKSGRKTADSLDTAAIKAKQLGSQLLALSGISLSIGGITHLIKQIEQVRAEFQDAESTLQTFLGSEEEGTKFFNKLQDYAYYNMFEFTDLQAASNQLIAYKNATEDIIPIIDRLSNVATATHKPLMQYVEMWNRAKQIGYVDSRSQQSWGSAGLVLNDVLTEMGQKIEDNKVSFEQLGEALEYVTSGEGRFAGIMDSQLNNLSAVRGQLEDDITNTLNEIGTKMEDVLAGGVRFLDGIVSNWELIGKAILSASIALGGYRTTLLIVRAVQKAQAAETTIWAMAWSKSLDLIKTKMVGLGKAMKNIGWGGWVGLAISAFAAVLPWIIRNTDEAGLLGKTLRQLDKEVDNLDTNINTEKDRLKDLNDRLKEAGKFTSEWIALRDEAVRRYGQYYHNLENEINMVGSLDKAYRNLANSISVSMRQRAYNEFIYGEDGQSGVAKKFEKQRKKDFERLAGTDISTEDLNELEAILAEDVMDPERVDKFRQKLGEYKTYGQGGTVGSTNFQSYSYNPVLEYVEALLKNKEDFDEVKQRTADKFRIEGPKSKSKKDAEREAAGSAYDTAKAALDEIQASIDAKEGKYTDEDLKRAGDALQRAEDAYVDAGGMQRTHQETYNRAKEAYDASKKEYENALKGTKDGTYTGTEAEFQQLKEAYDAATKAYRDAGGDTKETTTTKPPKNKGKSAEEVVEDRKRYKEAVISSIQSTQDDIADAEIDAIEDEDDKIAAKHALRRERAMRDLEEKRAELEELYKEGIPEEEMKKFRELEETTTAYLDLLDKNETAERQREIAEEKREQINDLLDSYASATDKEAQLEEEYNKDVALLREKMEQTTDEKERARLARTLDERKKEYQGALYDVQKASNGTFKKIFTDIDTMSKATLNDAIGLAEQELLNLYATGDASQIKDMQDRLQDLRDARDEYDAKGWGGTIEDAFSMYSKQKALDADIDAMRMRLSTLKEGTEEYKNLAEAIAYAEEQSDELEKTWKTTVAVLAASKLTDQLGKIGDELSNIGEEYDNSQLKFMGETFSELGEELGSIIQGLERGGIKGAAVAIATNFIKRATEALLASRIATEKAKSAADAYAFSLKMLSLQVKEMKNAFGDDAYGYAVVSWEKAQAALAAYNEQLEVVNNNMRHFVLPFGSGAVVDPMIDDFLKEQELIDEYGNIDLDKLKAYYEAHKTNDKELDRLIELKKEYDELKKSVESYVSSLVDGGAKTIADDMLDSFLKTGSAIADMSDNLNNFKKKLASSIIQSMLLSNVFTEKAQDDISNLLMQGDWNGAVGAFNDLLNQANMMSGDIENFLTGLNIEQLDSETAKGRGFQTMSQDETSELNGRFTALQISGENIEDNMDMLLENFNALSSKFSMHFIAVDDIRNIQAQALIELQGINENTQAALKPIRAIETAIGDIKTKVDKL